MPRKKPERRNPRPLDYFTWIEIQFMCMYTDYVCEYPIKAFLKRICLFWMICTMSFH